MKLGYGGICGVSGGVIGNDGGHVKRGRERLN